ncbi:hypothetical protein PIROE2DRAFT_63812 [Piromyces sp. E2]|nr:hypothetical protein PIROE2DRAFT_63812 [Piromyces sp. E2]|eukprot:OUM59376.1 hypothetical protein PIROE2DRAFT_63812 [Piromyces sp. E2]
MKEGSQVFMIPEKQLNCYCSYIIDHSRDIIVLKEYGIIFLVDLNDDNNKINDWFKKKDNIEPIQPFYENILIKACQRNEFVLINYIIQNMNETINIDKQDNCGKSALFVACEKGNFKVVQLLIEHGANVNNGNKNGYTPLMEASKNNYLNIVKYLVEKGANPNLTNKLGQSALLIAYNNNNFSIVRYLIDHGMDVRQLLIQMIQLSEFNNNELFNSLIDKGFDINIKNNYGSSPLMKACETGNYREVQYLVENNADVNHQNDIKNTPLIYASERGNIDIVKYLVEHGANINIKSKCGDTAISVAYDHHHYSIVKYLIEHGANINSDKYIYKLYL